ncbi:MAG: virulence factor family protein [Cupriavidus sp.]|nr:MAG: virulence factor family protein [Cupriavidus sp.]
MKKLLVLLLVLAAGSVQAQEVISHGRFEKVTVYKPKGPANSFVLFLSSENGWDATEASMAQALAKQGALVAGIDTAQLFRNLDKDPNDCVFSNGDMENLSHFLQAYFKLNNYYQPILVGYSDGATLAYATLAQSPAVTFAGGIGLGFNEDMSLHKPLCKGEGVRFIKLKDNKGVSFQPVQHIKVPFIALQGASDKSYTVEEAENFFDRVNNSELVVLPKVGHGFSDSKAWMNQYLAAFKKVADSSVKTALPSIPKSLGDLPVIEIKATPPEADTFAIIISGDGGWAGLDKEVGAALVAKGVPVIGVDSLRYFWSARTPDSTAADLDRIIRYYAAQFNKKRVVLVGYSQGADVLPFIATRLPRESRALVTLAAAIGMSEHAAFEFHLANWVSNGKEGPETLPEVAKINGIPFLCIYGADDKDAICQKLEKTASARVVKLPGGHHFNGNYSLLAEQILKGMPL